MLEKIKAIAGRLEQEIKIYQLALEDERTPLPAKFFLWLAIAYFFMPIDLIPDFIPVLGQLDDLLIVPLLVFIALKMIPGGVMADCRKKPPEKSRNNPHRRVMRRRSKRSGLSGRWAGRRRTSRG
ncbi:MAG: YkvA family protein [Candidatus Micrarchaeota archaeon]